MEDWFHIFCLLVQQTIESKKEAQREKYTVESKFIDSYTAEKCRHL